MTETMQDKITAGDTNQKTEGRGTTGNLLRRPNMVEFFTHSKTNQIYIADLPEGMATMVIIAFENPGS